MLYHRVSRIYLNNFVSRVEGLVREAIDSINPEKDQRDDIFKISDNYFELIATLGQDVARQLAAHSNSTSARIQIVRKARETALMHMFDAGENIMSVLHPDQRGLIMSFTRLAFDRKRSTVR